MELTAAPIVRQPMHVIGAPGKTDFSRIYIASELNKPEYRTTLRHEQAHVWAAHNRRKPKDARHDLWQIACEMEIARTIYDNQDIANITAPRSRLAGGYLENSINGLPSQLVLAEDVYTWLLEHPESQPSASITCCVCFSHEDDGELAPKSADAVKAVRIKLDDDEKARESQIAAAAAYALIKNRVPTLTSAIDAALRVRVERERSFRRASRRNVDSNVVLRGAISIPRPPHVEIFVDRSGSFTPDKTALAEKQLRELLARYGASIRSDVWFFGSGKLTAKDHGGGGDTPYGLISQHLAMTAPKLAIIITDDDPVGTDVHKANDQTTVLCAPIGCSHTKLAQALGGVDVVSR